MKYIYNHGVSIDRNPSLLTVIVAAAAAGLIAIATLIQPASAATSTVVTPTNLQGWIKYNGGANLEFVADSTAPAGMGALQMSAIDGSQYGMFWKDISGTQVKASEVNVSYATKRVLGPEHAAPAYVLLVDKDGDPKTQDGFYAIYEPAYNDNGSEDYNSWNTWSITAESKFWYTKAYGAKPEGVVNYTSLSSALLNFPYATISAVVLNIGTGNADWKVLVDSVVTTEGEYDFEPALSPTTKESCKNENWTTFNTPVFKNQGQCVASVTSNKNAN